MGHTRSERFDELLAEVAAPLARFLRRRTPDHEDVLSDVLLVLWRRLEEVPSSAPLPWAYGVARGCLRNAERAQQRRARLVRRVALQPVAPAPEADPDLAEALAGLRAEDQEVLRLWAWEQLPAREIAVVLGVSANAASIRLHRATTRLRTAMISAGSGSAGSGSADSGSAGPGKDRGPGGHRRVERRREARP